MTTCIECNRELDILDEDSRQEWYECHYECPECGRKFIHRTEFNQKGLVTSDTFIEEEDTK